MTSHPTQGQGAVRIVLSWPPSTNGLFQNVARKGRVRTSEYVAWVKSAGWELQAQRPPKFTGPVEIDIELCSPTGRAFDPDNRLKAPLDLLKTHGVIIDDTDRFVRRVSAIPVNDAAPCTVIVRPI